MRVLQPPPTHRPGQELCVRGINGIRGILPCTARCETLNGHDLVIFDTDELNVCRSRQPEHDRLFDIRYLAKSVPLVGVRQSLSQKVFEQCLSLWN